MGLWSFIFIIALALYGLDCYMLHNISVITACSAKDFGIFVGVMMLIGWVVGIFSRAMMRRAMPRLKDKLDQTKR